MVLLAAGCSTGVDAVSGGDVAVQVARWSERGPDVYFIVYEGDLDGREIAEDAFADRGLPKMGESDRFSVENLFLEIEERLGRGETVRAVFDEQLGYPTRVQADGLDISAKSFRGATRDVRCDGVLAGGATDLRWEATERVLNARLYDRWTDESGCAVRTDVITTFIGPAHCGWEEIEFLLVGETSGGPVEPSQTHYYVRDRLDLLGGFDSVDRGRVLSAVDARANAVDTGYRRDGSSVWHGPESAYRITDDVAEEFVLDDPRRILCA